MGKKINLIGINFGYKNNHTVLEETDMRQQGGIVYKCRCGECGNDNWLLKSGRIRFDKPISCGCLDNRGISLTKHGMTKNREETRFYRIWCKLKDRTKHLDENNRTYIERNITVCDRWSKFENFMEDMYESYLEACDKYGENEVSIDRIDGYGNYEPSNCRWANPTTQGFNRDYTDNPHNKPILCVRKDDNYSMVIYNAKQFSLRIFGTPNHHIIDVCKRSRLQEKGWVFSYIEKDEYYKLKESGKDYIENLYEFKISIPYHEIQEDKKISNNESREVYLNKVNSYYINSENIVVYGSKREVFSRLGFETFGSFSSALYKPIPDRFRKLTPEEIELHKNNQPIKF